MSDESKNASDVTNAANQSPTAPLTDEELSAAAGGIFRITNIRVNANGITGGGPIPANAVAA